MEVKRKRVLAAGPFAYYIGTESIQVGLSFRNANQPVIQGGRLSLLQDQGKSGGPTRTAVAMNAAQQIVREERPSSHRYPYLGRRPSERRRRASHSCIDMRTPRSFVTGIGQSHGRQRAVAPKRSSGPCAQREGADPRLRQRSRPRATSPEPVAPDRAHPILAPSRDLEPLL